MILVSEKTVEFLRDAYERTIDDWFDDPDEGFTGWTPEEFLEWYKAMLAVGEDIEMNFWETAWKVSTDFEIDRVQRMLRIAGVDFPVNATDPAK